MGGNWRKERQWKQNITKQQLSCKTQYLDSDSFNKVCMKIKLRFLGTMDYEIHRRYFRAIIGTHETSQICGVQVA